MNKNKYIYLISALLVLLLLTSACGAKSSSRSPDTTNTEPTGTQQEDAKVTEAPLTNQEKDKEPKAPETNPKSTPDDNSDLADTDKKILIIIDQTPKPITGNSFDFAVKKIPDGYALTEIQWNSEKTQVKNTYQEAILHGQNGEDGFYISGDGQFSGFFYPDKMKGENGQVNFVFINDQGQELTWKKKLTLK